MQSMSGWRLRFGVGAGAVGVVAEMSLSAGWLSVDWGVGGLCPKGLGLRSRWALKNTNRVKGSQLLNSVLQKRKHLTWTEGPNLLAGAGRAFVDGHEKSRRADFFELSLLTGVEEDHG